MNVQDRTWEPRIYAALVYSVDEIKLATSLIPTQLLRLQLAASVLDAAFTAKSPAEVKLSADRVAAVSAEIARGAAQIEALAKIVSEKFQMQMKQGSV